MGNVWGVGPWPWGYPSKCLVYYGFSMTKCLVFHDQNAWFTMVYWKIPFMLGLLWVFHDKMLGISWPKCLVYYGLLENPIYAWFTMGFPWQNAWYFMTKMLGLLWFTGKSHLCLVYYGFSMTKCLVFHDQNAWFTMVYWKIPFMLGLLWVFHDKMLGISWPKCLVYYGLLENPIYAWFTMGFPWQNAWYFMTKMLGLLWFTGKSHLCLVYYGFSMTKCLVFHDQNAWFTMVYWKIPFMLGLLWVFHDKMLGISWPKCLVYYGLLENPIYKWMRTFGVPPWRNGNLRRCGKLTAFSFLDDPPIKKKLNHQYFAWQWTIDENWLSFHMTPSCLFQFFNRNSGSQTIISAVYRWFCHYIDWWFNQAQMRI